ncbi:ZIP family metal transporter [Antarcticimicrobium sediminis]|uniref:Divalent cation transporter n=1 Tax=Antarcticimicrobium sediminis TaxID=2546227 RepID=A0A4R5EXC2_9RHOB|nr:divalent cation transporter [Antarcticimicrobium sediminis]TDE39624.1 divalent cation transporter [Antarcticimicrobium sediminis]
MDPLFSAVLLAGAAGLSLPLGGALARTAYSHETEFTEEVMHALIAFGGGALLSAVALVLVPEGAAMLPPWLALGLLFLGGVTFYLLDLMLERSGGRGGGGGRGDASGGVSGGALLAAMLLDFLPEAVALGAMLITEAATAKLLALMMFLQNVPEGFSAFGEIWRNGMGARPLMLIFVALAGLGPLCAMLGMSFLGDRPAVLGGIMIFAAGGILYLVFQDVAPAARTRDSSAPALGAVLGFGLGLAGALIVG